MLINDSEFLKVLGVGFIKLNKYGVLFLNIICDYLVVN